MRRRIHLILQGFHLFDGPLLHEDDDLFDCLGLLSSQAQFAYIELLLVRCVMVSFSSMVEGLEYLLI